MKKTKDHQEDYCDRTKLIRDLQEAGGGPRCFGAANGDCEHEDCAWRAYCLKEGVHGGSFNIEPLIG